MYLIFPWMKRPWLLLSFFVAYVVCELCGGAVDGAMVYAEPLTMGAALLISSGISFVGMLFSASAQKKAAAEAAKLEAEAAKAAANTPLAKARRKQAAAAAERIEADDYEGLNVGQKKDMMRQALEGFFASTSGIETQFRQMVGQMGFGRSGQVQEALSEMQAGAKDVAAKTATAADKLSAEIGQMEKARDTNIVAGTPDTLADAKLRIGMSKAAEARAIGEASATEWAGITGLASQTMMQEIPYDYQPWWSEKPLRGIDPALYYSAMGYPHPSTQQSGGPHLGQFWGGGGHLSGTGGSAFPAGSRYGSDPLNVYRQQE